MELKDLEKYIQPFNLFELVGVYLGDGSISFNEDKRVYKFEIAGNAEDEQYYFSRIANFLNQEFDLNPKVFVRQEKKGKTLRLIVDNKKFVLFLKNDLNLDFKNKTFTASIPSQFLAWNKLKHVIRGIFETDGSIYFTRAKNTRIPNYPRLEIKTSSKALAEQLLFLLTEKGFRVRSRNSKSDKTIAIYLSGNEMLEKWEKEIGFSKIKTITKRQLYKRLGHYLPKSSLQERLQILEGGVAKRLR